MLLRGAGRTSDSQYSICHCLNDVIVPKWVGHIYRDFVCNGGELMHMLNECPPQILIYTLHGDILLISGLTMR